MKYDEFVATVIFWKSISAQEEKSKRERGKVHLAVELALAVGAVVVPSLKAHAQLNHCHGCYFLIFSRSEEREKRGGKHLILRPVQITAPI